VLKYITFKCFISKHNNNSILINHLHFYPKIDGSSCVCKGIAVVDLDPFYLWLHKKNIFRPIPSFLLSKEVNFSSNLLLFVFSEITIEVLDVYGNNSCVDPRMQIEVFTCYRARIKVLACFQISTGGGKGDFVSDGAGPLLLLLQAPGLHFMIFLPCD
jgi:hypothetical protein